MRPSALDRKLWRDLRGSGVVVLAIASIIAVGVACFVAMRSAYHNLGEAKDRYYARCRMADFSVELKKAPLSDVSILGSLPGVTEIRPRIQQFVTVDLEGVDAIINGQVLSLPDEHRPIINDIVLKRGGYFTGRLEDEVIVNDAFARHHGLGPGDPVHLIMNDRRREFRVVGTAISSEFVYLLGPGSIVPDPARFGVFYLKRSDLEAAFGFEGACNQVVGRLSPGVRDRPDALLDRAELLLEDFGVASTTPRRDQISNRFLSDEIRQLGTFAFVMPAIFLAVAALVLNVLMGRLTEQQRTTIGTLKALGYTDGALYLHLLKFGVVVGLIGGLVGCGFGHLLAGLMTGLYRRFFELPRLENRVFPGVMASGVAISVAFALVGVARGARGVLSLEPAEAMRPKPPEGSRVTWPERIPWLWRAIGTGWRMILRNILRNGRRNLVGVVASMMAAALLVTSLMGGDAIDRGVEVQFSLIQRSDVDLGFRDTRGRAALLEASRLPGVDLAEPMLNVGCTFRNGPFEKRAAVTGLVPGARLTSPRDAEGRPVAVPRAGLALGKTLAEHLRVGPGDLVVFEPTEGRREPMAVPVVAIVDSFIGLAAYADLGYLSGLIDEEFAVSGVQLRVDPRPGPRRELFQELKRLPAVRSVGVREEMIASIRKAVVDTNAAATAMMIAFAGTIFFGTTLNASLVALAERRREVATLLVLGHERSAVGRLFLGETLVINGIGTLLGLPAGRALFWALIRTAQTDSFRIPTASPWSSFAWTLAVGLAFSLAAHAVVARSIARLDLQESMRIRE
ncbi:ABC transporter permease [Tautonia plasticadhaerens]|uniref:FtsX-like permease family protein n=1 Tax=Tautonia plasticadhaerens TaxID=2527974 RepID=A0A518H0E5_9BACT|nr:ABC transporter permease [Tautonia plasticadhaerens]QDV34298.1 FtsX-like permease family protein [Tautonia plasticadhaerens]